MSVCLRTACQPGLRRPLILPKHGNIRRFSQTTKVATTTRNRTDQYGHLDLITFSQRCTGTQVPLTSPCKVAHINGYSTSAKNASDIHRHQSQDQTSDFDQASNPKRALSRNVVITGGTSGIGFAIAKRALFEGASHVRIITRDAQRGQAAIDQLRKETSTKAILDHVVAETEEYADARLFHLDNADKRNSATFTTIIHSAGISQTNLLTSTRAEDIRKILSVNLESAALLSKSHLKRYLQTCMNLARERAKHSTPGETNKPTPPSSSPPQSWQIINISSLLAQKGGVGTSIYSASKAGLIALTRATALESAEVTKRYAASGVPGFRANVVVPGYIETPMTKGISGSSRGKRLAEIPAGRFGTPHEVADAVMFLLGNEYANNCVLNLDGGLSAV